MSPARLALVLSALAAVATSGASALAASEGDIGPSLKIVNSGQRLTPYGRLVAVGNVPTGGALTPDGRFYWTISAGAGLNDVRIVSMKTAKVVQVLPLPGASGGVAIAPRGGQAYVSGLKDSTNQGTTRPDLPGGTGDTVHVFSYSKATGQATETGQIAVPPSADADPPQDFPIPLTKPAGYPLHLAISPNGKTLLVPLSLAGEAAVVDVASHRVRTVKTGHYPYGAAILPDGKRGLVSNEAPGTVSVIDLKSARKLKDITVGGHLAHPEAIIAPKGKRAYVTVTNRDQVAVLDTARSRVVKTISVANKAGVGTSPNALAITRSGTRVLVSLGGADAIATIDARTLKVIGRIPAAQFPTDVEVSGTQIAWLSGKGLGTGANPKGPNPFQSATLDQVSASQLQFLPRLPAGLAGVGSLPSPSRLRSLTKQADAQLIPANRTAAPADTPVKPGGPIKHVFFIVRENRTYDQLLGDDPRGAGDPSLALFGPDSTPNLHALVQRFPLVDHVYANSEASQQGHQWTAAGNLSDFTEKNWNQVSNPFAKYGDRGRPLESGLFAVSFPPKGYLFDQAIRQNIPYYNYGEPQAGNFPLPYTPVAILAKTFDRDRNAADIASADAKFRQSDLGPTVGGCFPNAFYLGTDVLTGKQTYDSTLPPGAADGAESRFDCFEQKFDAQVAGGSVPAFNYITLPGDHTQGLSPGQLTPKAYVADNDYGTAQVIDLISHSSIWSSSAIFVVEDDSQDGADHVDAHRIPAIVASPYAKAGAVVSTRYDQLSVLRTMELMIGMHPVGLNDALATPMYDVFQGAPVNIAPYDAIVPPQSRTERNPGTARRSTSIQLDSLPQRELDRQLWRSVRGRRSPPPPPGPNASGLDGD
jgi:DNA-binding beta-propeller fold protein YncE